VPEKLDEPLSWKKPRRVFVNSMSDLFQDGVPDAYIDRVFAVMALTPQHTFQVLTKRAERMRA
jgi:protein gp37